MCTISTSIIDENVSFQVTVSTYTHTCTHARIHACTHTYTQTHTHTYTDTHTYTHMDIHIHTERDIHTQIETYIHITHIHICTHTTTTYI